MTPVSLHYEERVKQRGGERGRLLNTLPTNKYQLDRQIEGRRHKVAMKYDTGDTVICAARMIGNSLKILKKITKF